MSKFTPTNIREALSQEREAVQEYERSRAGAQSANEDSLEVFRERLKGYAETYACEAFLQYATRKSTLPGLPLGRRRTLRPGRDAPKAFSRPLQKLLHRGQSSWQSSLNWKGRSSSIIMDCRPFLDAAWGKRGPAVCTTEGLV